MKDMEGIHVTNLNKKDLMYVWRRVREHDRKELEIMKLKDPKSLLNLEYAFCGKYKGKAVSCFGIYELDNTVQFWWFATEEADNHWKTIHRCAKGFVSWIQKQFFDKKLAVFVWEEHRQARVWLQRLGFKETQYKVKLGVESMVYMEVRD